METIVIIWAALIVVFLIVEASTAGLASIWFAVGAVAALILALIAPDTIIWQVVLFIVVSVVALIFTRPLAKKYVNSKTKATNADRVIGKVATITERIDNVAGTGTATVGGRVWTARSYNGEQLEAGTSATIKSIDGVKLILQPVAESCKAAK